MSADVTFALRHAYTSRDTGSYSGGDHIIVASGELTGRLKRKVGDALCKPSRKFLALMQGSDYEDVETQRRATCKRCLAHAENFGVDLAQLSHDTREVRP